MASESILDACYNDISVSYWIQFSHQAFRWLVSSPMACLIIGGVFVISFLIVSGWLMRGFIHIGRGRSIKRLWVWGFPVALFMSVSPLLIGEPLLTQFLPVYQGQTADAVVVLGRGYRLQPSRVMSAVDLMSMERAPRVFVSGRGEAPKMANLLDNMGISASQIFGENCSSTTEENAQYTAQMLLPAGVRSIILVSDPLHLLRSQLVFKSLGFRVIPYASPIPGNLHPRKRRLLALRESVGFVTYGLMGRYWPRSITTVNTTAAQ